jgi:hypothetical protein
MTRSESLRALHDEAIALAGARSITREAVDGWRRRTLATLEGAYGRDSEPVRAFLRITFDDAAMTDVAARVLREKAAERGTDLEGLKIALSPEEKALRRGLYKAAEVLLSLMI